MKKLLLGTILLAAVIFIPIPAMARVDISIGISLPPPIVFEAPPDVVVMPDTNNVYVIPDTDADLFFWEGWWWRLWEGHWYRSHHYNQGWVYYNHVPRFYFNVDPDWRRYYRDHDWSGHHWNYERTPHRELQQNWKNWDRNRRWERNGNWGIEGYQPRSQEEMHELRNQRKEQYQQRPDVQRHQQWMHEQQRESQHQKSQNKNKERNTEH